MDVALVGETKQRPYLVDRESEHARAPYEVQALECPFP
jgi:hypothetical protein